MAVVPLLNTYSVLHGPPRQSGVFKTLPTIRNIQISIQIMTEISSEGSIFSTETYALLKNTLD